jgi:hypothetical protein
MAELRMVVPLVILVSALASAQSQVVTITEPGVYKISELFKSAELVALVKIVSGDTESYNRAVYKAEVLKSFKGAARGETVYFGPYVGERLGWEYILFLRNVAEPITPRTTSNAGYGKIHYTEIFDEGYSSMMTSFECVFDGKDTAQRCDDGVRVCTDYIVLPKSTPTFPPVEENTPFGCRWVRKGVFIALLETLANPKK